ncbi:MAG: phosphatidylcholine synthase [Alphaproteobacteria bacterium]|jgi:phosphatidylcholine synthase|nr:phosphatidylcholine synthase [Alphaproteobacteria bacterium]
MNEKSAGTQYIEQESAPFTRACAFAVHVFTASGAALAFLALIAAVRGDWVWMFCWLGAALVVDGVDGTLARRFQVAERLPRWSGESLDFVVDFLTYVFVPAYAITASGLVPSPTAIPLGILIVTTGALYFADRTMKLSGDYFRGFPVLWNVVAFYLFLLKPPPWIGAAGVVCLLILTFVPFAFIHPVRVRQWRRINIALLVLWSLLAIAALVEGLNPDAWVTVALCAVAVYFVAAGLLRSRGESI